MFICVCGGLNSKKESKTFFWYELIMSTNGRLLSFLHQITLFNTNTPHVLVVEVCICVCASISALGPVSIIVCQIKYEAKMYKTFELKFESI